MWQLLLELGTEILIFFEDLKFWKKKKTRRKLEKEQGLPKKFLIRPSVLYSSLAIGSTIVFLVIFNLVKVYYFDGAKQEKLNAQIIEILEDEKKILGKYPSQLQEIVRNNPRRIHIEKDVWGNELQYQVTSDGMTYTLSSMGKDGKPNTDDDIIGVP